MSSHLTLTFSLPLSPHRYNPRTSLSLSKSRIRCSLDREEQRWLREEQRWLREEQRWNRERDSLLREIRELRGKLEGLEASGGGASVAGLLKELVEESKGGNLIAESGSSSKPIELDGGDEEKEEVAGEKEEVKEVVVEEKVERRKSRRTLRVGAEGDEVREMQEALLKLGFYSGEEDMEFSSFSSGTESAVKTWQSTFGVPEDGVMTEELLERLYMEQLMGVGSSNAGPKESTPVIKKDNNGAALPCVAEVPEVQRRVVKEDSVTEYEASEHRVFLLGENRWEEPCRLAGRGKLAAENKYNSSKTQCLTCRGEGRLLCMECDGTGEPNVEEQFLEWVDGEPKCPYCEGLGYNICDVCDGKKLM